MAKGPRQSRLPAPYLKRILILEEKFSEIDITQYPFDLPWLNGGQFELEFNTPITIIVGENGTGKSTLIEAIAALAGYDEAGGGKGHRPVDHSNAIDKSGSALSNCLRGHWLPKITNGWFFRAESFFSVARYLDEAAALDLKKRPPPDFLSWSHGEGFLRFFEERCKYQGIYFMDEPESALSPRRQLDLLKLQNQIHENGNAQVILATHSPLLMALPCARLLHISRFGLEEFEFANTEHFRLYREFCDNPESFISEVLRGDL